MPRRSVVLLTALLVARGAWAQSDPTIKTAVVTNPRQMMVTFSQSLTTSPAAPHFNKASVRLLPDNVTPTEILQNSLAPDTFTLTFTSVPATATRICFDQVEFRTSTGTGTSAAQVCADLSRDPTSVKDAMIAAFQKVPTSSRDKNIFASGFVTTASEESAGGADISLNPSFNIPNLRSFLVIKKATANEGDARHFEAGARYRYTRSWKPEQLRAIAAETNPQTLNDLIRARQRNILAGWLVDLAAKLEGDPTNFDVTNFVGESSFRVQSMVKGFLGRKGFWRGFVLPAGVEVGQSIGTTATPDETPPAGAPAPSSTVNRIARYKAGAGLTVYYDNPGTQLGLRHVEVEINSVLRHLFLTESRFNKETKKTDMTDDGLHGYAQVDLKVFFVETDAGRFGFKLSFNRGRLPPVYAEVKSFDFGFVIESGDDNGKAIASNR